MANTEDKGQLPQGQEGTTGNNRGMTDNNTGEDMDAGNMKHGTVGGAGLSDDLDSTGAGSAGVTGGDISSSGKTAVSLKGNSSVEREEK